MKTRGLFVSPGGVRSIWLRHGLETFKKRFTASETQIAHKAFLLTDAQIAALERAKQVHEATGEFATEHHSHLGAQDMYYVGTPKGIKRIY